MTCKTAEEVRDPLAARDVVGQLEGLPKDEEADVSEATEAPGKPMDHREGGTPRAFHPAHQRLAGLSKFGVKSD